MNYIQYDSEIGQLFIVESNDKIISIGYALPIGCINQSSRYLKQAVLQLDAYFKGELKQFSLPIQLSGTTFQQDIYQALLTIPYGNCLSYGEVAKQSKHPKAARAVGNALKKNRLLIVVPCHRVVGAKGIGGFNCGIKIKQQLLDLENIKY